MKPPRPAPRYEYFSTPAPAATAGLQASGPVSAPPSPAPAEPAPAAAAPAAETSIGQPGDRAAAQAPVQAAGHAAPPRREGRRDKRPGGGEKSPFKDVLPPAKRVPVPNLRAALDEDLEQDFEAALAGVPLDDLITASTSARADAPIEPGTRLTGTVLSLGPDTAFIDLGERRQGAMKLAGLDLELVPSVGDVLELSVGLRNEDDGLYDVAFANRAVAVEDWSQLQAG
ncbi:MAG: hypothetical protein ACKOWG_17675, partial [Planctomycetia bacterium]